MNRENELRNQLKAIRTRLGLSQQDLATAAGVARQTIGGIEAGTYALSLTVALRLTKALSCTVEELFWLEDDTPTVPARFLSTDRPPAEGMRVAVTRIAGNWVAAPLMGTQAFRQEMLPVDGVTTGSQADGSVTVRLMDAPEALSQTAWLAGCTPALSLWARSAQRWYPGLRVHWHFANSMAALAQLAAGNVHLAGLHLQDARTGKANAAFVREAMPDAAVALVHLGEWEEGLLVAPGNPKRLQAISDLAQPGVRLINREMGAGARLLLESSLALAGIPTTAVRGFEDMADGHLAVAERILCGQADVGVSTASIAASYGLAFVPLRTVRYDLALRKETLTVPAVEQLLGTLHHRYVRSQLALSGGYSTDATGEITEIN